MVCKEALEEKTTQQANYQENQTPTGHRKSEENIFQEIWNPKPPVLMLWEQLTTQDKLAMGATCTLFSGV